ncbi:sugar porter family MFS transporter [Paraburkholderia guartelaensis]|uniref:Sugar porter family MFS transporter n=1 Tax=Paraburkholderia guartelaensis TaxID=2546446 RepID=A0A4R5LC15_9BURK|nr:sugar porter family MFS transporter [Paraburkholderia guartelaensis]TDG05801.1 sugar porter family MFS transporter [Paraburkholderia guartelaensis]
MGSYASHSHHGLYASTRSRIWMTCAMAALAGLLFGLDIGVIAGALPFIAKDFQVNDHTQEWIVSSMMVGAAVGALAAGWLSFRLGRKYSLLLGAALFIAGSLLCASAPNPAFLIGSRFVLGVAVGIATFTAPLYLSEIAPGQVRGAMVSAYQLMITVGILIAFLSDTAFSPSGAWRWMLGVVAIPAALFLLGILTLPRSPRWLMMKGRNDEARKVLNSLRTETAVVEREMSDIERQLEVKEQGFALLRTSRDFRRSLALGVMLQVVQQLTGINVVMYYAPRIFGLAGYSGHQAQLWGTVIVGAVNVIATFIAIGLVDRWGRRPILLTGFGVMTLGMGALGWLLKLGVVTHTQQLVAVAMLLVFIAGFAMSAGPMIWILCSEIQPIKGRDFGIAASTFTNWVANTIVGATFLTMLNSFGHAQTFWLYAALNAAFIAFTFWFVPETRGVPLETIEQNLLAGKPLREIGR